MKFLASIANIGLIVVMIYFIITEGLRDEEWLVILWFGFPILNLYALNADKNVVKSFFKMPEFLSLYFKRISLEQKAKIKELEEKIN